jgi:hypothetical protein
MKQDIAIEEIRAVRHRMSEECGHDLDRFFAMLKEEEKQFEPQIQRWREMQRRYQQASAPQQDATENVLALRDQPKT